MKLEWPMVVVFLVVFVTMAALVFAGKVNSEMLFALLTWLIPSPVNKQPPNQNLTISTGV